jgi:catechol 2,3-dioxygenase-like lactoylglutathione lyase family enzyme
MADEAPNRAAPILPVSDLMRSVAWYERLGFQVGFLYQDDGYAILLFDGVELHLAENPAIAGTLSMSGVYLRVPDADAVHARWMAMGIREVASLEDKPYGIREFATEDLDGNLWRVGANIGPPVDATAEPFDTTDHGGTWEDEFKAAAQLDDNLGDGRPLTSPPAREVTPIAGAGDAPLDGSPGTHDSAWYAIVTEGRRCEGCGLQTGELPSRALGAEIRDVVHAFGDLLRVADDTQVRERPAPGTWSGLEYGVHVRDVLNVFAERIMRTLREFDPDLPWWDHEADIAEGMANESDRDAVADDLGRNASVLSQVLREVTDDDWERPARRAGTERFTIDSMARFALHEAVHHRVDAERALAAAASN